jgi:hypothetical protein
MDLHLSRLSVVRSVPSAVADGSPRCDSQDLAEGFV